MTATVLGTACAVALVLWVWHGWDPRPHLDEHDPACRAYALEEALADRDYHGRDTTLEDVAAHLLDTGDIPCICST